jgi:hypothetical protein
MNPKALYPGGLPAPAGALVGVIADVVEVEALRVAPILVLDGYLEATFVGVRGLRPGLVLLAPAELRFQK